jgi:YHS domain-containing protein
LPDKACITGDSQNGTFMLSRRNFLAGVVALGIAPAVQAETPIFYASQGAAIGGYDTVSYFSSGKPVRGAPEIAVMWKGAVWHFATHENRAAFEANPHAYAPQFGGYCAYAMGMGYISTTDPLAWQIIDGKLYLIHSQGVERMWSQDVDGNISRAEVNWPAPLFD